MLIADHMLYYLFRTVHFLGACGHLSHPNLLEVAAGLEFLSVCLVKGHSRPPALHGTPKGVVAPMDGVNKLASLFISF